MVFNIITMSILRITVFKMILQKYDIDLISDLVFNIIWQLL